MMTMNLDIQSGVAIHSYVPGKVTLKGSLKDGETGKYRLIVCDTSLIVTTQEVLQGWSPRSIDELEQQHFDEVWQRRPELVLLGSGARFRFPHTAVTVQFAQEAVGLEVMDTAAACRTYNILTAEGRDVMALLLIE